MNPDEITDIRLWDYLDGHCTPAEKDEIENLLQTDPVWQERLAQLQLFQAELSALPLQAPSMRFTKNVSEAILRAGLPSPQRLINKKVIPGIAAGMVLLLGYAIIRILQQQPIQLQAGQPSLELPQIVNYGGLSGADNSVLIFLTAGIFVAALLLFLDALLRHGRRMRRIASE